MTSIFPLRKTESSKHRPTRRRYNAQRYFPLPQRLYGTASFHPPCVVDLVVTDPPYGMSWQSNRTKIKKDKILQDDCLDWLDEYIQECHRIMKDNTALYCFCSWHHIDAFKSVIEKYFTIKNILVWVKNNHGCGDLKAQYAPKYEFILYANKGRRPFTGKRMEDVFVVSKTKNAYHPTEKPVELVKQFILNSSNEGDLVFDGFMGSGTTAVACVNTGRKFLGAEIEEKYYQTAHQRVEQAKQAA